MTGAADAVISVGNTCLSELCLEFDSVTWQYLKRGENVLWLKGLKHKLSAISLSLKRM